MKFVIAYTPRLEGTAAENATSAESAQKLLASPGHRARAQRFVSGCNGATAGAGCSGRERPNPSDVLRDLTVWSAWLDFQLFPVVDLNEGSNAITQDALATARGVL
jgi:hypothetical protein